MIGACAVTSCLGYNINKVIINMVYRQIVIVAFIVKFK